MPVTEIDLSAVRVVNLPVSGPSVLACGAWLKNTVCLSQGNQAYLSAVIGDLSSVEARKKMDAVVAEMCLQLDIVPEIIAHDLHPEFYSTMFARNFAASRCKPVIAVQHHHAHVAAVCAEHGVTEPVVGLALDGVGLGSDLSPWGGELLYVDDSGFQRIGHLAKLPLPGGDRAAQEPWRMAAAVLARAGRSDEIEKRFPAQLAAPSVAAMLQRNINCPRTSSMGRLFDAAAGLLGVNMVQAHEAQAAVALQQLAEQYGPEDALENGYLVTEDNTLDFFPLLSYLASNQSIKRDIARAASKFHATLSTGLAEWVLQAVRRYRITRLAMGGGCFHNRVLLQGLMNKLKNSSSGDVLSIYTARNIPPDDSAVALGQAWIAIQKRRG
ncbi:hydrogenase maturation protein HypF [Nitrosomonas marina]|uniref:Hydrogenase maturation protein HypF n=1 Tax=Nitrosomonas marina TaxID=917 RepID=A0A1I0BNY5_9PROT|nr:carbamoyltransferase HypF [Nitrosomonas marina]SET08393.1 hydrogenase maturation protein HypF [Nitrosomonas marina]